MGVLQRIALCYLAAGLAVVFILRLRARILTVAGLVVAYELAMRLPLVSGWGGGSFALADNFARWVDLRVFGEAHLYRTAGLAFDPEGLLSTLPAVVTTLLGFYAGEVLRVEGDLAAKLRRLAVAGLVLAGLGLVAAPFEPVNKQLWTFSYVLVTGGLALLVLAACSWMIDVRGWRRGTRPAVVFGSNPLVVFLGSGLLARTLGLIEVAGADGGTRSLQRAIYAGLLEPAAGPLGGSLLHALLHVGFWLAVAWWLWRRRIFLKV
jgi:predicted acyltransferase